MQKKNKASKAHEILWFAIMIVSIFVSVHKTYTFGYKESLMFYGFVFLAFAMYLVRKKMRQKQDNEN